jgi:hypothetical protein
MDVEDMSLQTARPTKPAEPPDKLRRSPVYSCAKTSQEVPEVGKRRLTTSGMSKARQRWREGTTQSAEAAETVAPSQMGWNMPALREEMLFTSGMLAGASEVAAKQGGAGGYRAESSVIAVTWTAALRTGSSSC